MKIEMWIVEDVDFPALKREGVSPEQLKQRKNAYLVSISDSTRISLRLREQDAIRIHCTWLEDLHGKRRTS